MLEEEKKESEGSNHFEQLPAEVIVSIYEKLNESDKSNFALSCLRFYKVSQRERLLSELLKCVISGNQDRAEKILKLRPELAAEKMAVTDWSGRRLICSPFEYALWVLDARYMCVMMLDCLPNNEKGESIRKNLDDQAQLIQKEGLTYQLNGVTYKEKHFNLALLKNALKHYIDGYRGWKDSDRKLYWYAIGKIQSLLPAHIRQHYCDIEEPFKPTPKFNKRDFKRFLNLFACTKVWNTQLAGLGDSFTMWRASEEGCVARKEPGRICHSDYKAIAALEKMRLETDLPELLKRLEAPLSYACADSDAAQQHLRLTLS